MDAALGWLGAIVEWFGKFIPRYEIIDTTQGAVKWIGGSKVVTLGPGVHWYWPFRTKFQAYPTVRQSANLTAQTLVTKDDKTVIIGGLLVYEIKDLEAILAHTYDPEQTIKDIAATAIQQVIVTKTWDEIKADSSSGKLARDLKIMAKRELDRYGVRVLKATLTDLATAKVFKLIQSTAIDGM